MAAGDGRGVRRPRRLGAGDARRGRPGRVHHRRARPGSGWLSGGTVTRDRASTPPTSACPGPPPADLRGGDVAFNADVARRLLAGETGPVRDAVLVNAAAALAAHDGAAGRRPDRGAARRHRPRRRGDRLRRGRRRPGPLGRRRRAQRLTEAAGGGLTVRTASAASETHRCTRPGRRTTIAARRHPSDCRSVVRCTVATGEPVRPARPAQTETPVSDRELLLRRLPTARDCRSRLPPCADGHDADCPELVCTRCGAAGWSPRSPSAAGRPPASRQRGRRRRQRRRRTRRERRRPDRRSERRPAPPRENGPLRRLSRRRSANQCSAVRRVPV